MDAYISCGYGVLAERFHEMQDHRQPELIEPEHLVPRLRWEQLFAFLPPWAEPAPLRGRKPVDRNALLKACIYQRLTRQRFLTQLCTQLQESPPILAALGFDPYLPPPPLERFSSFLGSTDCAPFLRICIELTRQLLDAKVMTAAHVGFDSCPVPTWVRENNLKTGLRHCRYDKRAPPRADPDARLGVRIHYPSPDTRKLDYFWGYRHHLLVDLEAELPLWAVTEPCNVAETTVAVPLLESAVRTFGLTPQSVCGDAEYDASHILRYIQETLKARAYIPFNPRHIADQEGFERHDDKVLCPARLAMYRHGRMTVKGVTYIQYRCPFFKGPRPELLICPADHPKFTEQKGCNYLWRLTDNPRDLIPYGTEEFRLHYNRRTAVERVFSRLLAITLQEPAVRGLQSVRNHCLISDIAVLLVALAAHRLGYRNKTRYVRTLVPYILT
jgi:hypothetical protein